VNPIALSLAFGIALSLAWVSRYHKYRPDLNTGNRSEIPFLNSSNQETERLPLTQDRRRRSVDIPLRPRSELQQEAASRVGDRGVNTEGKRP
jgi:hypothetical protein